MIYALQDFYEPIHRAGLLDYLKDFLSHDDADLRSKACSAIGNMCRHSPYFYSLLVSSTILRKLIFVKISHILKSTFLSFSRECIRSLISSLTDVLIPTNALGNLHALLYGSPTFLL